MLDVDHPRIEFLVLAEHVEVIHGKLYLMGGGWDMIHTGEVGIPNPIHFAVGVLMPWQATNRAHLLNLSFQSADAETLVEFDQEITLGRPAGMEPGTEQRQMLAFHVPVEFPSSGSYVLVARLNEDTFARTAFRVFIGQAGQHVH